MCRGEFEGVGQKIKDDLPQADTIAYQNFILQVAFDLEGQLLSGRITGQHALNITEHNRERKGRRGQFHLAAFNAADIQNIIDQAQQIAGG